MYLYCVHFCSSPPPYTQGAQAKYGSHNFTCNYTNACLYLVSVHQWRLPRLRLRTSQPTTYLSTPKRMKGWVGLVGWRTADGLPTWVVTRQLQVERCPTGKVHRSKSNVLPLCHATKNQPLWPSGRLVSPDSGETRKSYGEESHTSSISQEVTTEPIFTKNWFGDIYRT